MLKRTLMMMLVALFLAACGGSAETDTNTDEGSNDAEVAETTTDDADEEEADDAEPSFILSVTGAETFDFEGTPIFGCAEDEISLQTFTQSPKLTISLPANIQPGTFPLADYDANASPSYIEDLAVIHINGEVSSNPGSTRGKLYFINAQGELIIDTVPSAPGEQFVATLNGELSTSDGETISFSSDFDFATNSFYFMDCQFADGS